jgi:hypothetical protein
MGLGTVHEILANKPAMSRGASITRSSSVKTSFLFLPKSLGGTEVVFFRVCQLDLSSGN